MFIIKESPDPWDRLISRRVCHKQGLSTLNEDIFAFFLGGLIHILLVIRHQGFGDGLLDSINLGHMTLHMDPNIHISKLLLAQKQNGVQELVLQRVWLDLSRGCPVT